MVGVPTEAAPTSTPLALTVGCTFGFETPQPVSAVFQVAPIGEAHEVRVERWGTDAEHHTYRDLYGNRCERLMIPAGTSRLTYEADVTVPEPADRILPGTPETPIEQLSDELRGTVTLVKGCLDYFERIGLVAQEEGRYRYAPVSPLMGDFCDALETEYRARPVALISLIAAPEDKIRQLADAFRFRGSEPK